MGLRLPFLKDTIDARERSRATRVLVFILWGVAIVTGVAFVPAQQSWSIARRFVGWTSTSLTHRLLGISILIALASWWYWLRKRARVQYGVTEVGMSTALMWFTLGSSSLSIEGMFGAIVGAAYVFVRGIDNIEQGFVADFGTRWHRRLWHFCWHGVDPGEDGKSKPAENTSKPLENPSEQAPPTAPAE